jgi:hypothetical protein
LISQWDYGADVTPNDIHVCDVYVLETLICPLILSSDLLYGNNAFTVRARDFYETDVDSEASGSKHKWDDSEMCILRKEGRTLFEAMKKPFSKPEITPNG